MRFREGVLKAKYDSKVGGAIGHPMGSGSEVVVLHRVVRCVVTADGRQQCEYELDERHSEVILKQVQLDNCKSASSLRLKHRHNEYMQALASPELNPGFNTCITPLYSGSVI